MSEPNIKVDTKTSKYNIKGQVVHKLRLQELKGKGPVVHIAHEVQGTILMSLCDNHTINDIVSCMHSP